MEAFEYFHNYIMQNLDTFLYLNFGLSLVIFYGLMLLINAFNGGGSLLKNTLTDISLYFLPGRKKRRIAFIKNAISPKISFFGWSYSDLNTQSDYIECFHDVMGRTYSKIIGFVIQSVISILLAFVLSCIIFLVFIDMYSI